MKEKVNSHPGEGVLATPHSRRSFLKGMGIAAGATVMLNSESRAQDAAAAESANVKYIAKDPLSITLNVNGKDVAVKVEPRTTLLDALREQTGNTSPKEVCDRGSCGCCTVLLNGQAVTSCMMLAVDAEGAKIQTAEGIAQDPKYKALMQAYYDNDGAQCGFCIPGFVVRSAALLDEKKNLSPEEIRKGLSGNICRCGTYTKIFESMAAASAGGAK